MTMARRFDISDKLIHFTRSGGECMDDAFATLKKIIREGQLIAGNGMIRGGYRCVCFTEAPIAAFAPAFVNQFPFTRYSTFGLMFEKNWIHERGGRHCNLPAGGRPSSSVRRPPLAPRPCRRYGPIRRPVIRPSIDDRRELLSPMPILRTSAQAQSPAPHTATPPAPMPSPTE